MAVVGVPVSSFRGNIPSASTGRLFLRCNNSVRLVCRAEKGDGEQAEAGRKRVKKRVAMFCGYVGSGFKGLQINRNVEGQTVESVLEKALVSAGGISPLNYGDLKKVRWTRSSRTDKGVHSTSTILSLRMLVPPDAFSASAYSHALAEEINAHLPDSVRIFSIQKVTKGFTARHMCDSRTYHYYLPLKAITSAWEELSEAESDEILNKLKRALKTFEGRHPFHNFTDRKRYREKEILPKHIRDYMRPRHVVDAEREKAQTEDALKNDGASTLDDEATEYSEEGEGKEEEGMGQKQKSESAGDTDISMDDERVVAATVTEAVDVKPHYRYTRQPFPRLCWWNDEIDADDQVKAAHYRHIFSFTCGPVEYVDGPQGSCPAVRLEVKGGSFMIYQIRFMIGTAVAVARGDLPENIIAAAISAPARFNHLPLAPPSTLILADAHFFPLRTPHGEPKRLLQLDDQGRGNIEDFQKKVLMPALYPLLVNDEWEKWIERLPKEDEVYYDNLAFDEVIEKHGAWRLKRQEEAMIKKLAHKDDQEYERQES